MSIVNDIRPLTFLLSSTVMPQYANLSQHTPDELDFWKRFTECAGQVFHTAKGLEFTFAIRGNEVFFDRKEKSITRSSIIQGYRKAQRLLREGHIIDGPKQLGVFGASYLYPVFHYLGALEPVPETSPEEPRLQQLQLF